MTKQEKQHQLQLQAFGLLIADALLHWKPDYRPTISDVATANAFDAVMQAHGRPQRAWRGSVEASR